MQRFFRALTTMVLCGGFLLGCEKASETTEKTSDAVKSAADSANQAGQQIADKAKEAAASVTAEAQKLLDQATAYVKEKKFDLAEPIIAKLEGMKAQLPAEWATKIEQARSMFDSAKKAMQALPANLPGASPAPAGTN
jgi:hypothetical protein